MEPKAFQSETQLVRKGRRVIRQALRQLVRPTVGTRAEVPAPGSVPDFVMYTRDRSSVLYVVTFEFKLASWRRALGQAFRHRNFGNEAYVVLDRARIAPALKALDEFRAANVGLLSIDWQSNVEAWHYPTPALPFSKRFSRHLAKMLLSPRKTIPDDLQFTRSVRGGSVLAPLRRQLGEPSPADQVLVH